MHSVRDHVLSFDGTPIYYEVCGEGEPALVFIHGWCCERGYWVNQLSEFAQRHKVVAVDLAGHGESGLDRKAWTIPAFGEDVVAVAEKLGLSKAILIGHSLGGSVIVEAARRMPEQVIGLVGADTFRDVERTGPRNRLMKALLLSGPISLRLFAMRCEACSYPLQILPLFRGLSME
jgi:pimeloyl-ACP methyl ester carboxylesterase